MRKFFREFKEFISRGNILDMAIGVIIGSAFSAIVTAFTNKIIMPLVNLALAQGGAEEGLEASFTFLKKVYESDGITVDLTKSIYIDWGAFITAIINFLIIALTLFIILKVAMHSSKVLEKARNKVKAEYKLTKADKKEAKERGINPLDVKAMNKFKKEKAEIAKAEAEAKLKEEQAKIEAEKLEHPSQEDLLKDIRDLLQAQAKPQAKKDAE